MTLRKRGNGETRKRVATPLRSEIGPIPRFRDSAIPRLSVIVPTYNERDSLPALLARLEAVRRTLPLEVVIVDDASPDGTGPLGDALARAAAMPVTVLHRPHKSGLASAAIDGAAAAHGPIVTIMDGDLSHPPELLPDLTAAVESGAAVAVASRYVRGGGIEDWSLARRGLSLSATWLTRTILGLPVRDPLSGFFAARRELLTGPSYFSLGYKLLVELLVRHPGIAVVEVPYRFADRRTGQSKLTAGEAVAFLALVARLRRRRRPLSPE
jgi:dolichol-phosphate mannosyltransferase